MEGELAGKVVHAAGVHQTQSVSHRLGAQHALACDGAEAAVGQSRRHDAGALTGHLDGAQLTRKDTKYQLITRKDGILTKGKLQPFREKKLIKRCFFYLFLFTWK